MPTPRYLVPFHPKRVPHYFTDVLIIGGGVAGLRAAMEVDSQQSVRVITKAGLNESNSRYAQGGIAGVLDEDDTFEEHVTDTITAGGMLCNREIVEKVVHEGPRRIHELIDIGTQFDTEDGRLVLGREGGHRRHRVAHAMGDATGKEIMRALIERVCRLRNVEIWQHTFTIDLLTENGECRGALIWNQRHGKTLIWAKQTILASGGAGQIYRETTNPAIATGDGHAFAYRAGAELRDMEFMQFHPTVLYIAGSNRSLITEAMRGEGARLLDCNGHRFMADFDDRGELAPRDIVAQAIVSQMEKTEYSNVFLDMSHLSAEFVRDRFPGIAAACNEFGIDITVDRIPVRPGAHYMIGGLTVDERGQTTLPNLWAAGEVSATGLHGANRLASNSLLEGLVYGALTGEGASKAAATIPDSLHGLGIINPALKRPERSHDSLDLIDIRNSLKSLMWRAAGVRRDAKRLTDAGQKIEQWCRYVFSRQFDEPIGWELQNSLFVARIMIRAALAREESRGVHLRTDFPTANDELWRRHQTFCREE